jgi:hypothetical protein
MSRTLYAIKKKGNNRSIPSMHAERKITNLSVKHSFTLYPSLSPYGRTESLTEEQIHPLRLGWRNYYFKIPSVNHLRFFLLNLNFLLAHRNRYSEGTDDAQKTPRRHPDFNSYIQNLCVFIFQTARWLDGQTDGWRN